MSLVGFTAVARAADPAPPVALKHTEHRTIASARIGQTCDFFVSLPEDYLPDDRSGQTPAGQQAGTAAPRRDPVLYVLDGWHFPLLAFLQNNSIYSERMPPVIMVNIGHGRGVNPMPLRARDFTPTKTTDEPTSGGAAAFLDFLKHEVIPLIDRTYRTNPADRGLLGHSYGGLFALYALEQCPGLFQRIVAASPVVGWDHDLLSQAAAEKLQALPKPVRLDLSAGDEPDVGGYDLTRDTTAFARNLEELKPANLDYRFTVYPGENHNSVRLASFPSGLYWVYRP